MDDGDVVIGKEAVKERTALDILHDIEREVALYTPSLSAEAVPGTTKQLRIPDDGENSPNDPDDSGISTLPDVPVPAHLVLYSTHIPENGGFNMSDKYTPNQNLQILTASLAAAPFITVSAPSSALRSNLGSAADSHLNGLPSPSISTLGTNGDKALSTAYKQESMHDPTVELPGAYKPFDILKLEFGLSR